MGEEFATAVANTIGSTRYHSLMRKTATTMDDYETAVNTRADALAKADQLLTRRNTSLRHPLGRGS
jgi:hypothetical protein